MPKPSSTDCRRHTPDSKMQTPDSKMQIARRRHTETQRRRMKRYASQPGGPLKGGRRILYIPLSFSSVIFVWHSESVIYSLCSVIALCNSCVILLSCATVIFMWHSICQFAICNRCVDLLLSCCSVIFLCRFLLSFASVMFLCHCLLSCCSVVFFCHFLSSPSLGILKLSFKVVLCLLLKFFDMGEEGKKDMGEEGSKEGRRRRRRRGGLHTNSTNPTLKGGKKRVPRPRQQNASKWDALFL